MNNGWIKLHRQFTDWEWYTDHNTLIVFIHCLLKANHKDRKWRGETIKRGEFFTGLEKFSIEVNLSMQKVRTSFKKLESTGEVTRTTTSKGTRVIVCNYNTYQSEEKETNKQSNKQLTNKQQTNNKQVTTNKNDKNDKNDNKNISPLIENFERVKQMERPLTEEQVEKLIKDFDRETVIEILQDMENYKNLLKNNVDANLTARRWIKKNGYKKNENNIAIGVFK